MKSTFSWPPLTDAVNADHKGASSARGSTQETHFCVDFSFAKTESGIGYKALFGRLGNFLMDAVKEIA